MPHWLAIIGIAIALPLALVSYRVEKRARESGIPYLFFWPHPFYARRTSNRKSSFFRISSMFSTLQTAGFGLLAIACLAYLFEPN